MWCVSHLLCPAVSFLHCIQYSVRSCLSAGFVKVLSTSDTRTSPVNTTKVLSFLVSSQLTATCSLMKKSNVFHPPCRGIQLNQLSLPVLLTCFSLLLVLNFLFSLWTQELRSHWAYADDQWIPQAVFRGSQLFQTVLFYLFFIFYLSLLQS